MYSQSIKGIVYDNESTVKGTRIFNLSQKIKTYLDDEGNFKIKASVKDTIEFYSLFHNTKHIIVTKKLFNKIIVIELKKTINELDEVLLKNEPELKTFIVEEYEINFKSQLAEDIKRHPSKYEPSSNGNIDFRKIAILIGKLFKKKKKTKNEPLITTTYKEFDSLFSNDVFFNNKLLTTNLKISNAYKPLFFDYCDARQIDKKLLSKKNRFLLLDTLMNCSKEFHKIISNYEKE